MNNDLMWGIKNGDLDQVKELIEKTSVNVNEQYNGRSLLHYAADYGQTDVLDYLITRGADVNAVDKHGISSLLAAIWEGHTDCVRILLKWGASPNGQTPDGDTYIQAAEKPEIRALLV